MSTLDTASTCFSPSCQNKGTLLCSSCKVVRFCGRECQKEQWKAHKHLCKALAAAAAAAADSSSCLILDGMGPLGCNDINSQPIQKVLTSHGLSSTIIHLDKGQEMPAQIAAVLKTKKQDIQVCVILGWGSGDGPLGDDFGSHAMFRKEVVQWVESGGRLIVQGERIDFAAGDWPKWFDLEWKSHDYYRTTHSLNTHHWAIDWFQKAASAPPEMDIKGSMIKHVATGDILFGTTEGSVSYSPVPGFGGRPVEANQAAFAVAKYGEGTVSFFADVNAEECTMATIGIIAKGDSRSSN